MRSLSIFSGLALFASLTACNPQHQIERRSSTDDPEGVHLFERVADNEARTSSRETIYPSQETRTSSRETIYPSKPSYTEPQETRTSRWPKSWNGGVIKLTHATDCGVEITNRDPQPHTTYVSVYNPDSPDHQTHHRSENQYTTIYVSLGNPTTYVQPIYVRPTSYAPPVVTQVPAPQTYTTIYVYPDPSSSTRTYYSTITTYVTQSQPVYTVTTTIYQTYVPPVSTVQPAPSNVPTPGINPWSDACPLPSKFVVNNFTLGSGGVTLSISYNGGTFKCPNTASNEVMYNGMYDMYCDDDGLVRVLTDGSGWIWVSEWSWCNAVPAASGQMPTIEASTNYTTFGNEALTCQTRNGKVTCTQSVPKFTFPVAKYGLGGSIGFEPLDVDGNYLPNCPSKTSTQPIVTNTASCAVQTKTSGLATVTITA